MKKIFSLLLITCFAAGTFNKLEAQRRENQDRSATQPVRTFPHTSRATTVRPNNTSNNRNINNQRNGNAINRYSTPASSGGASSSTARRGTPVRVVTTPPRNLTATRSYRQPAVSRSYNYPGNYRYTNNYYGNSYHRTNYVYRPVFMHAPRYTYIPRASISIHFGGRPYYYNQGYFYGYYSGYYQPLFPPFGIRINVLPFGYSRFFVGPDPFYYYNGIYYRPYNDNTYEVVDAPMGATVSSLPKGARSVVVNGEKLYELNGTYYKADRNDKGADVYIVVGKNGEINNTTDATDTSLPSSSTSAPLQAGDVISQLPEGSKVVTINGEKLYVTPYNVFLNENTVDGVVEYTVVGK
ncbi:MAG: DUF6515 family protein [Ginsengibacter sp.]